MQLLLRVFVCIVLLERVAPVNVAIRNTQKLGGNSKVDAHDGPIVRWSDDGPFYRYAMSYTRCQLDGDAGSVIRGLFRRSVNRFIEFAHKTGHDCGQITGLLPGMSDGFGEDCGFKSPSNGQTVKIYKSNDLNSWEFVGDAFENGPKWLLDDSIIFRPAIVYNKETAKYVLWVNRLPRREGPVVNAYVEAGFAVGTSESAEGPFVFPDDENEAMPKMVHAGGADFSLLQDEESGEAYIAYGAWHNFKISSGWRSRHYPDWMKEGHQIAIQRLDPTSFTKPASPEKAVTVTNESQEAPSFFKRGQYYYLVHGNLCCFCERGSDAKVLVSKDPMGPFVNVGNLNVFGSKTHVKVQSSDVFEVKEHSSGTVTYIWSGDLWFSSKSRLKGEDYQYWHPLVFKSRRIEALGEDVPVPERLHGNAFLDCFEVDLDLGTNRAGSTCDAPAGNQAGEAGYKQEL